MKKRWMVFLAFLCVFMHSVAMGEEAVQALLFSWWGNAEINEATQAAMKRFEGARQVAVIPHAVQTRDEQEAWLSGQWESGTAGDVVELDAEMLRTMARNADGSFRLADVEAFPKQLDLTQFSYLGLMGCLMEDRLCAVPISMSSHVFFWNTTALNQSKRKVPASEADLFTLAQELRVSSGAYPLAASAESRIAFMVTYLQSRYGQAWINEKTKEVSFTIGQVAEGLRCLDQMEKRYVWPKLSQQGDLITGWREGKYLGIWAWDSLAMELNAAKPEKAKMSTTAQLSTWAPYDGGFQKVSRMLAIPEGRSAQKASALLIDYLLNSDRGVRILKDLRGTPDSANGALVGTKYRLLDSVKTQANKTALSWARYPMPMGFEAPELVGADGVYAQVLLGYSEGLMTDEAAAAALISGVKMALQ